MNHFVLTGAGFSRAFSDQMPLLADLADDVLASLGLSANTLDPFSQNLEQWFSYLSTDQPWLTDAENLRNRAQFREASQAVKACIEQSEDRAITVRPPAWATRLVNQWCDEEASVATFNYDLLIERLASRSDRVRTWSDLYGMSLAERLSPGTHLMFAAEQPSGPVCRLFKMHGSINWHYGGLDAPSTDRVVLQHQGSQWPWDGGSSIPGVNTPRDEPLYDDLVPLIVPPTGLKATYYGNASLRAQWRRAFRALREADRVSIIGYSFPPSDLVSRHLISTAQLSCPITVVDRSGMAAAQLTDLAPNAEVSAVSGQNAVQDFCDQTCPDFIEWSAWRTGDRYAPRLWVNGIEETALRVATKGTNLEWDQPAILDIVHSEIDRRWPGLRSTLPESRRTQYASDGNQVFDGYVGRK